MNPQKKRTYYSENSSPHKAKHHNDVFIWSHGTALSKTVSFEHDHHATAARGFHCFISQFHKSILLIVTFERIGKKKS